MPNDVPSTPTGLTAAIDAAWAEFKTFLAGVTDKQTSLRDASGWSIKDHAMHVAVWEDSVAILFRGGQRHAALGIDESFYQEASFDQINEILRDRFDHLDLRQVVGKLNEVHGELMIKVRSLTADQLQTTVRDFFPQAPRTDDRLMFRFIYDNTADHFAEHLPWMQAVLAKPA